MYQLMCYVQLQYKEFIIHNKYGIKLRTNYQNQLIQERSMVLKKLCLIFKACGVSTEVLISCFKHNVKVQYYQTIEFESEELYTFQQNLIIVKKTVSFNFILFNLKLNLHRGVCQIFDLVLTTISIVY